jgi:hypothetical protein
MIVLPAAVLLAGAWIMAMMCARNYVIQRVAQLPDPKDRKPLNQRLRGYDADAVERYWSAFDAKARRSEQCFLALDLVFPLLYGSALFISLFMAWTTLGRPIHPIWITAPVAITVLADWTENLVHIGQLRRYTDGSAAALHSGWIRVASAATVLKLTSFAGTTLLLAGLIVGVIIQALP